MVPSRSRTGAAAPPVPSRSATSRVSAAERWENHSGPRAAASAARPSCLGLRDAVGARDRQVDRPARGSRRGRASSAPGGVRSVRMPYRRIEVSTSTSTGGRSARSATAARSSSRDTVVTRPGVAQQRGGDLVVGPPRRQHHEVGGRSDRGPPRPPRPSRRPACQHPAGRPPGPTGPARSRTRSPCPPAPGPGSRRATRRRWARQRGTSTRRMTPLIVGDPSSPVPRASCTGRTRRTGSR